MPIIIDASSKLQDLSTAQKQLAVAAATIGIGGAVTLIVCRWLEKPSVSKLDRCRAIIDAEKNPDNQIPNSLNKYDSRAQPNERLVTAFGINNSFTASNKVASQAFRKRAEDRLAVDKPGWVKIEKCITDTVRHELGTAIAEIDLSELAQLVAMKAIIGPLLEADTTRLDNHQELIELASQVNTQWLLSKSAYEPKPVPIRSFEQSSDLQEALEAVFPGWRNCPDTEEPENPLNYILPGYETLWRVVLRGFIEVVGRNHDAMPVWTRALGSFVANPCRQQLLMGEYPGTEELGNQNIGVSALAIAKETLRLYPPTRRIYRTFTTPAGESGEKSADIEDLHRDTGVWGDDAELFRPERWHDLAEDAYEGVGFLAFGAKPHFACPARRIFKTNDKMPFGVAMVALIIGVLSVETNGKWKMVGELEEQGVPLKTDREAYHDLKLRCVEKQE